MKKELAEGWRWSTIEEVCKTKPRSGGTPLTSNSNYYGGNIPWVITEDLTNAGMYISQTIKKITKEGLENSNAQYFPKDTILFAMYGSIGRMSIATIELTTNQAILGLIPDHEQVITKYLYYYLNFVKEIFIEKGRGGTQSNINAGMLCNFPIIVPPLTQQQKIANKLDKQMAQIEMMKKEAEKTRIAVFSYNQSFINKLVEVEECKELLFGDLIKEFKYGSSEKASGHTAATVPILRIPNIIGKVIDLTDLKHVELDEKEKKGLFLKRGDILFVRTNGNPHNIGRCSLFDLEDDKYVFASYLIRARVKMDKVVPEFIDILFKSGKARDALLSKAKTSVGNYNINTVSLRNIRLRIPSIEIQKQIVAKHHEFLDCYNISMGYVNDELNAINQLPASILNEVFGQYQINS